MVYLQLNNVTLDIPVFDAARSFRRSLLNIVSNLGKSHSDSKHPKAMLGGNISSDPTTGIVSVRALDNISLRFNSGDRVGVIGHNGAGKSTLLRVLAGVYEPLIGNVVTSGKLMSLMNLSLGLDMDDTGLQNINTVGMYLGMGKEEIARKIDQIVDFSDLDKYINLPVKTYSSGMLCRLSFAIATSLEPNILVMDEGIGVADAQFAEKANLRLKEFYDSVEILVVASHSEGFIKSLCNKAILLEKGKLVTFGDVDSVLARYKESHSVAVNA